MNRGHAAEVEAGERFTFGENWARFLTLLDERRIRQAEDSLREMLGIDNLQGKRFLDLGSGSGLFSLAARRLGATVRSVDYDPQSVACTLELKRRHFHDDADWAVEEGSVLDAAYILSLGQFDVVYSWGVLHHTGQMMTALANIIPVVASEGQLFVAIYNDQRSITRYWKCVKRVYNRKRYVRGLLIAVHAPYLVGARWLVRRFTGRHSLERGMSLWYDMVDWLGGYPFEAAAPETIFRFFRDRGFLLDELRTCGGRMGCNEFVFHRLPTA